MGVGLILYLTGAVVNLLLMIAFRGAFAENGKTKKTYWFICAAVTLLSYIVWVVVLTIVFIDTCINMEKNNESKD